MEDTVTVRVRPGEATSWVAVDGTAPLGEGSWDEWSVCQGLDALVRMIHRAGRTVRVVVEPADGSFLGRVAERSIARVLDVYESAEADWA